jgi:hypothetical protein
MPLLSFDFAWLLFRFLTRQTMHFYYPCYKHKISNIGTIKIDSISALLLVCNGMSYFVLRKNHITFWITSTNSTEEIRHPLLDWFLARAYRSFHFIDFYWWILVVSHCTIVSLYRDNLTRLVEFVILWVPAVCRTFLLEYESVPLCNFMNNTICLSPSKTYSKV